MIMICIKFIVIVTYKNTNNATEEDHYASNNKHAVIVHPKTEVRFMNIKIHKSFLLLQTIVLIGAIGLGLMLISVSGIV